MIKPKILLFMSGQALSGPFHTTIPKNSLYPLPHILPRWCEITHPRFSFPNGRLRRMKGLKTLQTIPKKIFLKLFTRLLSVLMVSTNFCGYNAKLSCLAAPKDWRVFLLCKNRDKRQICSNFLLSINLLIDFPFSL